MIQHKTPDTVLKTSIGFYTKAFPDPRPLKNYGCYDDEIDWSQEVKAETFLIPATSDTGPVKTKWRSGGLIYPRRADYGMPKSEWNIKVVRPLETLLSDKKFTGELTVHFNEGVIVFAD